MYFNPLTRKIFFIFLLIAKYKYNVAEVFDAAIIMHLVQREYFWLSGNSEASASEFLEI